MLAGLYDPDNASGGLGGHLVNLALAPEGDPVVCEHGAFAVGVAKRASLEPVDRSGVLAAIDGTLYATRPPLGPIGEGQLPATAISRAHESLGVEMLNHLRGSFALAVWNPETRRGMLSQDHLGDRTMFFSRVGQRLLFASEIHLLLRMLPRRPAPDEDALLSFLAQLKYPLSRTLYEGIERVGAAHFLEFGDRHARHAQYWKARYRPVSKASPEELADEFRAQMERTIDSRIGPSDSPAVALSGGFDSSAVAAFASRVVTRRGGRLKAYSAVFPEYPETDESSLIARTAGALDLASTTVNVTPNGGLLRLALEYLRQWQLPLLAPGHANEAPLLERAARDGVTIMFDGQGGDELFGISPYLLADRLFGGRIRTLTRLLDSFPPDEQAVNIDTVSSKLLLREYALKGAVPWRLERRLAQRRGAAAFAPPYFLPGSAQRFFDDYEPWAWKRGTLAPRWWAFLSYVLTQQRGEFRFHDYFRHRALSVGMDFRSPYISDVDLNEFMLRVPPELAFDKQFSRAFARRAMVGLLEDSVRIRPRKANFTPFAQACVVSELPHIRRLLISREAETRRYVDVAKIQALLDMPPDLGTPLGGFWTVSVWRLVAVECWLRSQIEPAFAEDLPDRWQLSHLEYRFNRPAKAERDRYRTGSTFFPS